MNYSFLDISFHTSKGTLNKWMFKIIIFCHPHAGYIIRGGQSMEFLCACPVDGSMRPPAFLLFWQPQLRNGRVRLVWNLTRIFFFVYPWPIMRGFLSQLDNNRQLWINKWNMALIVLYSHSRGCLALQWRPEKPQGCRPALFLIIYLNSVDMMLWDLSCRREVRPTALIGSLIGNPHSPSSGLIFITKNSLSIEHLINNCF